MSGVTPETNYQGESGGERFYFDPSAGGGGHGPDGVRGDIYMGGERQARRGGAVRIRANNGSAVAWVKGYRGGGKKQTRGGALMRMMGALEARGGVVHSGKARTRGRFPDGRWTDTVEEMSDPGETKHKINRSRLAGAETRGRGAADVFGDIARGCSFGKVAALTGNTYKGT